MPDEAHDYTVTWRKDCNSISSDSRKVEIHVHQLLNKKNTVQPHPKNRWAAGTRHDTDDPSEYDAKKPGLNTQMLFNSLVQNVQHRQGHRVD